MNKKIAVAGAGGGAGVGDRDIIGAKIRNLEDGFQAGSICPKLME